MITAEFFLFNCIILVHVRLVQYLKLLFIYYQHFILSKNIKFDARNPNYIHGYPYPRQPWRVFPYKKDKSISTCILYTSYITSVIIK